MDDRHLKSTSFERTAEGYLYYENAWAKGVPVSADERQLYLSGAHTDWLRAIVGREAAAPRRPYWKGVKRLAVAALTGVDPDDHPSGISHPS